MSGPVLVTGATGFAGSHLVEYLSSLGTPVVGWDRQQVDLLDRMSVRAAIQKLRPSAIYHCAGAPHVGNSWELNAQAFERNVLATHHVFDALRRAGVQARVLIPGSAMVYAANNEPLTEDHPLGPTSPYALSKLAQEELGMRAMVEDGVEVVLTRSFNHTGPRQLPSFVAPGLARQFAMIEAGKSEPVVRLGNIDSRRDLTDVRDTVRAYYLLMERGRPGIPYNVCSGESYAVAELLEGFKKRVPVPVRVEVDPELLRRNDPPVLLGSAARLHRDTGWSPEIPLDRTLDDLLEYWRGQVAVASSWEP
jgi:GDP-4-dehydro-6-deoxy-D-mannose reductase